MPKSEYHLNFWKNTLNENPLFKEKPFQKNNLNKENLK